MRCDRRDPTLGDGAYVSEPFKATRAALQNATSIGSPILTTETLIGDEPERSPPTAAALRATLVLRLRVALRATLRSE